MRMAKPDGVTTVENGSDANGFKCHQLTRTSSFPNNRRLPQCAA